MFLLKILFRNLTKALKSQYNWFFIFFGIWLYRVECLSDVGFGLPKILQIGSIIALFILLTKKYPNIWNIIYSKTNMPFKSCIYLYSFAVISTLWAFLPTYTLYMSIQNIIILASVLIFCNFNTTFKNIETLFIITICIIMVLLFLIFRILYGHGIFSHILSLASTAAMLISYSSAELLTNKKKDLQRTKLLKAAIILSIFILVTQTSSGANASALLGLIIGFIFSGKILWLMLIASAGIFIYFNQDIIDNLILLIMPGKTLETFQSASGRETLWEFIWKLIEQKPLFGWGYGCGERAVTDIYDFPAIDAHNVYLGILCGIGIIGLILFIIHILYTIFYCLKRHNKPGYTGILAAVCCGYLNGYSYGFLSGKACCITVTYFLLIGLTYAYSKNKQYS